MAGLKMEGIVKWRGLKSQGPLYMQGANQGWRSQKYLPKS